MVFLTMLYVYFCKKINKKINPQHRRLPIAADCIQYLQEPLRVLSFAIQLLQRQAGSRTHRSVKIPRPFRTCPDASGAGNALPHIHLSHIPQINGPHGANLCTGSAIGAVLVGRRVQRQAQRGFVGNGPLDVQRCRFRPQLLNHGAAESVQLAGGKLTEFLYLLKISDVRTARRYFLKITCWETNAPALSTENPWSSIKVYNSYSASP